MKRGLKTILIKRFFVVLVSLLMVVISAEAQEAVADGFGEAGDTDAPLDGGLGFLLAAGAGYGIKKYRDNRKKNQQL